MALVAQAFERPPGATDQARERPVGENPRGVASEAAAKAPRFSVPLESIAEATDDALVRATVEGQRSAFTELVKRYTNLVFWYLSGRLDDPLEVEEAAQETMVRAYTYLPRLRAPRAFGSWLTAVAGNVLSEKRRADSRSFDPEASYGKAERAAPKPPIEKLSEEEISARLSQEMERLPVHHRVVLALKHMSGCSVGQIARQLQIPAGTVRSRLSRAYDSLRKKMEPAMLGRRTGERSGGTCGADQ